MNPTPMTVRAVAKNHDGMASILVIAASALTLISAVISAIAAVVQPALPILSLMAERFLQ